jgi:hypothetical protein
MIHRWQRGLDLIKYSGVEYDAILIIRPDIYFWSSDTNIVLDKIVAAVDAMDRNTFYSAWPMTNNNQDDTILLGYPYIIFDTIGALPINEWDKSSEGDWHTWFWQYLTNKQTRFGQIVPTLSFEMCRPNVDVTDDTCEKVQIKSKIWRYALIDQQCKQYGRQRVKEIWHDCIFDEIELFRRNFLL